jgi:hypothetical protein
MLYRLTIWTTISAPSTAIIQMQITAFRNTLVHNINSNGQQLVKLIMPKLEYGLKNKY